jgi:hypothetical protein
MTDIVERLRGWKYLSISVAVDCSNAADEIERLREIMALLLDHYLKCYDGAEDRLAQRAKAALKGEK